jgi:hypothetical protein
VTWHSGGLQAIRIDRGLRQAGWFSPHPLDAVANEDPALSAGPNKVVMWSFPIIRDGLIYVIDIRNGLYVLRYNVERQREVRRISFLDGHLEPHRRASPNPGGADDCRTARGAGSRASRSGARYRIGDRGRARSASSRRVIFALDRPGILGAHPRGGHPTT